MLHANLDVTHANLDVTHARRLALRAETTAASAKSWAIILQGRLTRPKPIDAAAIDVACDICRTMATEADELRKAAVALEAALYRQMTFSQ
jgi:hypothetical protein